MPVTWILLAALSGPLVHVAFSFFLGWKEFMPSWDVPSIQEVVREGPGVTTPVVAGPTPFG